MEGMRLVGSVDPTPMRLLADRVLKSLGVGPRLAIDGRQRLPRVGAGNLRYHLKYKNLIVRARTGRIDNDCTCQLRVDTIAPFKIVNFRSRPVEIQARCFRCETDLPHSSRRDAHDRIAVGCALAKTMHDDRDGERISQPRLNLRALRHSDEWTRILQGFSALTKGIHGKSDAILRFRMPHSLGDFKMNCQNAVAKDSRGHMVLVGKDSRQRLAGCSERRVQQQKEYPGWTLARSDRSS